MHWIALPIVLPVMAAAFMMLVPARQWPGFAWLGTTATALQLPLAGVLLAQAVDGGHSVYALGGWPAPFGIVLVLDRLSALMLLLGAVLASAAHLAHQARPSRHTRQFQLLFQFQLMGINGAFLTGDLFNLFVFFEILLIASYGLLLQGGGPARTRAGLHYVLLNLVGSSLFLIAMGVLYADAGTLNMADLARVVMQRSERELTLLRAGLLLLTVVFALKAALLPLHLWLPATYAAAIAPVAALFAIMTKVGAYAVIRVLTLVFGLDGSHTAPIITTLLVVLALATVAVAGVGALGSVSLRRLAGYLVILSIGSVFAAVAVLEPAALSAALYYMIQSTLMTGALFLLADLIAGQRGPVDDSLQRNGPPVLEPAVLGTLFFATAVAIGGLPPLSGFFGKLLILRSAASAPFGPWLWITLLTSSLLVLIALSRAGSRLFWSTEGAPLTRRPLGVMAILPPLVLLLASPLLVVFAAPVQSYLAATASQLASPKTYVERVLGTGAQSERAP
jgi:multicomponent K+:H+ antiporter subunit D